MTTVFFHPEANAELIAAAVYYEGQQEELGKRFLSSVEDSLARIRINPRLYPVIDGDVRNTMISAQIYGVCHDLFEH